MRVWMVVAAVMVATSASAQDVPSFSKVAASYALFEGLDAVSTEACLARGCREMNPMYQTLEARVAWSSAKVAGLAFLDRRLQQAGHRRMATVLRWSHRIVMGGVAAWNVRNAFAQEQAK